MQFHSVLDILYSSPPQSNGYFLDERWKVGQKCRILFQHSMVSDPHSYDKIIYNGGNHIILRHAVTYIWGGMHSPAPTPLSKSSILNFKFTPILLVHQHSLLLIILFGHNPFPATHTLPNIKNKYNNMV